MNFKKNKFRFVLLLPVIFVLHGCASLFPAVIEIAPNTYAIGNPETDMKPDSMLRAQRISEATLFCTGQRSSVALIPVGNDSSAYVKFQCIYFPNDAQ